MAGLTLETVAKHLTELGRQTGKAAVSAWEVGRNVPDALVLRRLAKLYGTTTDALLWDEAISMEAIRFAVQYDALNDKQQRSFRAMWLAYFEQAASDEEVEKHIEAKSGRHGFQYEEVTPSTRGKLGDLKKRTPR